MPDITQVLKLVAVAETAGLGAMHKGLDELETHGSKTGSVVSGALKGIGIAAAAGGVAVVAGLGGAVKTAADFQQKMNDLQAATGVSTDELKQLHDAALQVGKDTPKSASEAAEAFTELAKAGVSVKDIVGGIGRTVVDMATATGAAVPDMANLLVAGMQSFGASADQAGHYANTLSAAAQASTLDIGDFARALQTGGATAKSAGLSIDDFSAAIAVMGNNGIQGAEAGTMLKTMLLGLEAPTSKGKAALDSIGVSVYDSAGKMKPFAQLLDELTNGFSGLTEEERNYTAKAIFGTYGINAANILLKDHAQGYKDMTEAMGKQLSVSDQTQIRMKGLSGQIEQLKGSLETAAINVGEKFLPVLTAIAGGATDAVNGLLDADWSGVEHVFSVVGDAGSAAFDKIGGIIQTNVIPWVKDFAHWIGDVAAPAIQQFVSTEALPRIEKLGTILQQVAGFVKNVVLPAAWKDLQLALTWIGDHKEVIVGAVAALSAVWLANAAAATAAAVAEAAAALPFIAITAAVIAVGAGIALLITHWDEITAKFPILGTIADTVGGKLSAFRDFMVNEFAPRAKEAFDAIVSKAQDVIAWIQEHWDGITSLLEGPLQIAKGLIQGQFDGVKDIIETAIKVIQDIIKIGLDIISGNWSQAWTDIKGLFSDIWNGIQTFVGDQLTALETVLGGVWITIRNTAEQTWNEISGKITGALTNAKNTLGDTAGGILGGIHDAVTGAGHAIWQWFVDRGDDITHAITHPFEAAASLMKGIVNLIVDPLRLAITGINTFGQGITGAVDWVLGKVGLGDHAIGPWIEIANIPQFAKGVTNWQGGMAWVGEAGPEIMYVPQGATILPAAQSKALAPLLSAAGLPGFEGGLLGGLGDFLGDVGGFFKGAASDVVAFVKEWTAKGVSALIDHALDLFGVHGLELPQPFDAMGPKLFGTVKDAIVKAITNLFTGANNQFTADAASFSGGVVPTDQQANMIRAALTLAGAPTGDDWVNQIAWIVAHEDASWDPMATNPIPVGPAGEHATGIMQTLPSTFAAFALPGHGNIYNPLDNLIAGIRYIIATYGTPFNAKLISTESAGIGYADGGLITEPITGIGLHTGTRYSFGERGIETVIPGVLPGLASGGIAIHPGLAYVGEAGAEVITPIGDFLATIGATAEAIGDRIAQALFQLQQQHTQAIATAITTVAAQAFKPFDYTQKVAAVAADTAKQTVAESAPAAAPSQSGGFLVAQYGIGQFTDNVVLSTVHYAAGGLLTEPVYGVGLRSGLGYSFAENGVERVTPGAGRTQSSGGDTHIHLAAGAVTIPARDLDEMRSVQDFFDRLQQEARARGVQA